MRIEYKINMTMLIMIICVSLFCIPFVNKGTPGVVVLVLLTIILDCIFSKMEGTSKPDSLTAKINEQKTQIPRTFIFAILGEAFLIVFLFLSINNHMETIYEDNHPASKVIVYTTEYGSKYHADGCGALWNSKFETTQRKAVTAGYGRCSRCSTPKYTEEYNGVDTLEEYFSGGYVDVFIRNHPIICATPFLYFFIILLPVSKKVFKSRDLNKKQIVISSSSTIGNSSIAVTHNAYQPSENIPPVPSQISRTPNNKIEQNGTTSYAYIVCRRIWTGARSISTFQMRPVDYTRQGYAWAALFYVYAKSVNNKKIINEVYSYFEETALPADDKFDYTPANILIVRTGYTEIAKELNVSKIDPTTPVGRNELWGFISKRIYYSQYPPHEAKKRFQEASVLLSVSASVFKKNYATMPEYQTKTGTQSIPNSDSSSTQSSTQTLTQI